jgi:hypothetical protein
MLRKGPQLESNVVYAASGTLDAIVARPVHALIRLDVVLVADVAKHDLWAGALGREARSGNNFATSPGASRSVPHHAVHPDLERLLTVAAALMGLRSTHGGVMAALEGGVSGAFDSSAAEAQVERAILHVTWPVCYRAC